MVSVSVSSEDSLCDFEVVVMSVMLVIAVVGVVILLVGVTSV